MKENKTEWLTVREFAQAAGVSKQAIYQAVDKHLTGFVKEIDGVKHVDIRALSMYPAGVSCQANQSIDSQAVDRLIPPEDLPTMDEIDEIMEEDEQERDYYILELKARIESLEEDKRRLYSLLEEKEKTLQQAQALHLGTQVERLPEKATSGEEKPGFWRRILKK